MMLFLFFVFLLLIGNCLLYLLKQPVECKYILTKDFLLFKVLKLYAWEEAFQEKLLDVRDQELSFIRKSALYFSGTVISLTCAPVMVSGNWNIVQNNNQG